MESGLDIGGARARVAALVKGDEVRGAMDGDRFWIRPGRGLGAWHAYVSGEVVQRRQGSAAEMLVGIHPLGFALEAVSVAVVLFWGAAIMVGVVLSEAAAVKVEVTWQPIAAVFLLAGVLATVVYLHRAARAEREWVVDLLRHELGNPAAVSGDPAPAQATEP